MNVRTTIKRSSLYNEYIVRLHVNGKHIKESDYHTTDKKDAEQTAALLEREAATKLQRKEEGAVYSVKVAKIVPASVLIAALRSRSMEDRVEFLRTHNLPNYFEGSIVENADGSILYEKKLCEDKEDSQNKEEVSKQWERW